MIILGIETSCDETSCSIIQDGLVLSNIVYTQKIHEEYGGVVPEIASREHDKRLPIIINKSLSESRIELSDIDAISVTYGAGLIGSLIVGLNFAKGLSIGLNIPLIPINHLEAHMFASSIDNPSFEYPFLSFLVTGGHTQIWLVNNMDDYLLISDCIDDAAGEAFDKGARILGLRYPGGPEIDRLSSNADSDFIDFPRPFVKSSPMDFSFSGLKTSLYYYCSSIDNKFMNNNLSNIAASYQEAIIDTLLDKLRSAIDKYDVRNIYISGGVAANSRFRSKTNLLFGNSSLNISFTDLKYCTDNAAMIGVLAYMKLENKDFNIDSNLSQEPIPNLSLE
tara:strand:+ start:331 stop:1338 length:1008 start_codon:yes stop_codon:yes gene_type:complete